MVAFAAFAMLPDADVIGFALRIPYAAPWGHTLASHGLLDALTDGGLGIALLWPFTNERFFAPWAPIPVAPIGTGMLSSRGVYVVAFELMAFAPFWLWALRPQRSAHS